MRLPRSPDSSRRLPSSARKSDERARNERCLVSYRQSENLRGRNFRPAGSLASSSFIPRLCCAAKSEGENGSSEISEREFFVCCYFAVQ